MNPTIVDPPKGTWLLGNVQELQQDPLGLLTRQAAKGDVIRLRLGHRSQFVFFRPDHVRHVLVDSAAKWGKPRGFGAAARPLLGNGLLNSEGEFWKRQRRIANPLFHRERVAGFGRAIASSCAEILEGWSKRASPGELVDVTQDLRLLALRIVGRTVLGVELGGETDQISPAVAFASRHVFEQASSVFVTPRFVPTPGNRQFRRSLRILNAQVASIIALRRSDAAPSTDLLQMLLASCDEQTGERMTDEQLRDEVTNFYLAGHETAANAIAWILYLVSERPEVMGRLRAELDRVLAGRPPAVEDMAPLVYTNQVVLEALRLYPPAWILSRSALVSDVIDGIPIKRNTDVFLSPYLLHRHPDHWQKPNDFFPDHFAPEHAGARHPYAFIPFGAGQRKCIGSQLALLELQMMLAMVVQRFDLDSHVGPPVLPVPAVTLSPSPELRIRMRARAPA